MKKKAILAVAIEIVLCGLIISILVGCVLTDSTLNTSISVEKCCVSEGTVE